MDVMQEAQLQNSSFLNRLYAEQIRLTYQQLPTLTISNMIGSIVLAFVMWDKVSYFSLIAWLSALFIIVALGSPAIVKIYRVYGKKNPDHWLWGRILVVYLFVRAVVWGSGGILFYIPGVFEYQVLLLLFIIGGAGLVAIQAAAYKPAFFTMLLPILSPVIVRFSMDVDVLHIAMAFVTLVYGVALAYFYQNIHRTLEESLLLRFEKASLAEKLAIQKQAAEKAYADKTRFVASVSHDLRQPLHAQGLFIAELKERIKNGETKAIVDKLDASLNAMSSLFNSLMDLSKLDINAIQPRVKQFAISELFDGINLDFQSEASAKNLQLKVLQTKLIGKSDPQLLGRILRNLVANAIEYTQHGQILLGCRRRGDKISIQVWDTGIGIPDDQRQSIFEEYRQLNQCQQNNSERSGLGLAIVARLSRLLNHEVNVQSRSGKGTLFSIDIARCDPVSSYPRRFSQYPVPTPVSLVVPTQRVLLIEDDEHYRQQTATLLTKWGINVLSAADEKQVLELMTLCYAAGQNGLALIITDYHLSGAKTGLELLNDIRIKDHAEVASIILTGDHTILRHHISPDIYLLHKPVRTEKLKSLIEFILNQDKIAVPLASSHDSSNHSVSLN